MIIDSIFTAHLEANQSVYSLFSYEKRTVSAGNRTYEVEVPVHWSENAAAIFADKYLRKKGVPSGTIVFKPSYPVGHDYIIHDNPTYGSEKSVQQVVHRLAYTWAIEGLRRGYFGERDAKTFYNEVAYMLLAQIAAPNSPQWFNTGLYHVYGIHADANGAWAFDKDGNLFQPATAYENPQVSACFIQSIEDNLLGEGGIMDALRNEAAVFKMGSGSGINYSNLREAGAPLSGGGKSSGLMSFLKPADASAGAIKSGGTTRRSARMVIVDDDHPDVLSFIRWKAEEERKVRALVAQGYPSDYEGEAYRTVSGQNANNSVRISDAFMDAVEQGRSWQLRSRVDGSVVEEVDAEQIWHEIGQAAWECADPGIQFDGTINRWHTCKADGRQRASNPCSEYLFLDNTACNLASLNLVRFLEKVDGQWVFNYTAYHQAIEVWTVALDISVGIASYPTKALAEGSRNYRTLGLGFANLGGLLMRLGVPYDSDSGRVVAGLLASHLSAVAYCTSSDLSRELGVFPRWEANKQSMTDVLKMHLNEARQLSMNSRLLPSALRGEEEDASAYWDDLANDTYNGFSEHIPVRNAQISVIAPTGTIGLLMDCDTTGIEPDFALVKWKKLSGGGYMKIVNQSVKPALENLGYSETEIEAIVKHIIGHGTLEGAPVLDKEFFDTFGLTSDDIGKIDSAAKNAFHIDQVINYHSMGEDALADFGIDPEEAAQPGFSLLRAIGLKEQDIDKVNAYVCGHNSIVGAPFLKEDHYAVFDCATGSDRFIAPMGHVQMMAAVQSFVSGAISKTVNMPHSATVEDIKQIYRQAYKMGVKAIAVYRDGSKASQPLSGSSKKETNNEAKEEVGASVQIERAPQTRERLSSIRRGYNVKFTVESMSIYMHTGEYEDGRLGEIFFTVAKEGSTLSGLMEMAATSFSIALQHGAPLETLLDKWRGMIFAPNGIVADNEHLKMASSIPDAVARILSYLYLGDREAVQNPSLAHKKDLVQAAQSLIEELDKHKEKQGDSRSEEYTGAVCSNCGSSRLRRTGSCHTCEDCGTTTGCS